MSLPAITAGSVVICPGGEQRWVVRRVYQEVGSHRQMAIVEPAGESWSKQSREIPVSHLRLAPPDMEEFPCGPV